jgi:hypothetical protein
LFARARLLMLCVILCVAMRCCCRAHWTQRHKNSRMPMKSTRSLRLAKLVRP